MRNISAMLPTLVLLAFALRCAYAEPPVAAVRLPDFATAAEPGKSSEVVLVDLPSATLKSLRSQSDDHQLVHEQIAAEYVRVIVVGDDKDVPTAKDSKLEAVGMAGNYTLREDKLVFAPRYPYQPGLSYVVHWRSSSNEPWQEERFSVPAPEASRVEPRIVQVFPTARELPENHLRFYVHFATPMQRGQVYQHLKLTRDDGTIVPAAFLELTEEAWDRDQKRLTLLLDPGRIKHALVPHKEQGPILEKGRHYEFSIEPGCKDVYGKAISETFRVSFRVNAPNTERIDPQRWKRSTPRRQSTEPFTITFPVSMDQPLAAHAITIIDERSNQVKGTVKLESGEKIWIFEPDEPWSAQSYFLRIESHLEDTAGNNLCGPLETALDRAASPTDQTKPNPKTAGYVLYPIKLKR